MIIDSRYFEAGPRHIQNASLGTRPDPNAEEVRAAIDAYIAAYEGEFMRGVLGKNIAVRLLSEAGTSEECHEVVERLKEPLADYVFFHILQESSSQATITGLVRLECANSYVSPIHRQVHAWNRMVDALRDFAEWSKSDECRVRGIETATEFITKINPLNI